MPRDGNIFLIQTKNSRRQSGEISQTMVIADIKGRFDNNIIQKLRPNKPLQADGARALARLNVSIFHRFKKSRTVETPYIEAA
jgi:hypothetical protein